MCVTSRNSDSRSGAPELRPALQSRGRGRRGRRGPPRHRAEESDGVHRPTRPGTVHLSVAAGPDDMTVGAAGTVGVQKPLNVKFVMVAVWRHTYVYT